MFPGVSHIHIEVDGHHDPAIFIKDGAPVFRDPLGVFPGHAVIDGVTSGDLLPVIQVIQDMKNLMIIREFNDGFRWEDSVQR